MTTGRINQVTTFLLHAQKAPPGASAQYNTHQRTHTKVLSLAGVRYKAISSPSLNIRSQYTSTFRLSVLAKNIPVTQTPCIPISHVSSQLSLSITTKIATFGEDYQQPMSPERHHTVTAYPRVI